MGPIRGVILDIDGVLVRGDSLIPGADAAVAALRRQGLQVACCTNENRRTPAEVAAKLSGLGLPADPARIVTSGRVAARVVAQEWPGVPVLALGGPGLLEPLRALGVALLAPAAAEQARVLVMGRDPAFDYTRLEAACRAVWHGARFVATNDDPRLVVENGYLPGTGAMVRAVAYATGVEPVILGKPSRWAAETCLELLGLPAGQVVMVGDQYRQDMGMGKTVGMRTVLVLSGCTGPADLGDIPPELQPDAVLPDLTHLPGWLAG